MISPHNYPRGVHGLYRLFHGMIGFRFRGCGIPCKAPGNTPEFRHDGWVYLFRDDGFLHMAYEESSDAERVRECLPLAFADPPITDAETRPPVRSVLKTMLENGIKGDIWYCDTPETFKYPVKFEEIVDDALRVPKGLIIKDVVAEFEKMGDAYEAKPADERFFFRPRGRNSVVITDGRIRIWSPVEICAVDINGVFVMGFQNVGTWQQADLQDWQMRMIQPPIY